MTTAARKLVLYAIMIAIVVVVVEAMAAIALYVAEKRHPGLVRDLFIQNHFSALSESEIESFRDHNYDPRLGWDYRPGASFQRRNKRGELYEANYAEDGSRRHDLPPRPLAVAAYGDSFTAGVEVNDDETWPYFLERILGREVKNFGSGGYGTGQAVLKFEDQVKAGHIAPITILGIHEENIGRVVNNFRPFYITSTGIRLGFKPAYACTGVSGELVLKENPLASFEEDPDDLMRIAQDIADRDFYAHQMVRFRPPFLPKAIDVLVDLLRDQEGEYTWISRDIAPLWADPATSRLMECIIEHFIELARRHGSVPVLLFLPKSALPVGEGAAPAYADMLEDLRRRFPDTVMVDIAAERFDAERFLTVPDIGHPSAYGNEIIAGALARAINPLLPLHASATN